LPPPAAFFGLGLSPAGAAGFSSLEAGFSYAADAPSSVKFSKDLTLSELSTMIATIL